MKIKENISIQLWVFEDLCEENNEIGYRFNDVINQKWCFIPKKIAETPERAADYISKAHEFIERKESSSKIESTLILFKELVVLINF